MLVYEAAKVLEIGLDLVGFDLRRQQSVRPAKNAERFATHYVASASVVSSVWFDVQGEVVFTPLPRHFKYFLIAIHVLAKYPTELELEAKFNVSDRTARDWV